ncbi:MAG: hypothetical protein D6798_19215 [Deltaproteobacteria bacterium]|nr:MAG: hypothetical protein D6798_19215 [Deltaproteobacteria bacterium]
MTGECTVRAETPPAVDPSDDDHPGQPALAQEDAADHPDRDPPRGERARGGEPTTPPTASPEAESPGPGPVPRPDPVSLDELPNALDWQVFRHRFWLDDTGAVAPAPWNDASFRAKLVAAQARAIIDQDWPAAYTFAAAAQRLDCSDAATIGQIDALRSFGEGLAVDLGENETALATDLLNQAVDDATPLTGRPRAWVWLALLVFAADPCPLLHKTIENLSLLADLDEPANLFLLEWHTVARGGHVAEQLRQQLDGAPRTLEELEQEEQAARQALQEKLKARFMAAGGTIQRTHCRKAWDGFMAEAHPVLSDIASGRIDEKCPKRLRGLRERATRIFDREGAKFQDRRRMDRAVAELLEAASHAVDRHRELVELRREEDQRAGDRLQFTERALSALDAEMREERSVGGFIARLVHAHIHNDRSYSGTTSFDNDEIRKRPLLIEAWPDAGLGTEGLDALQVADPLLASARLLDPPLDPPPTDLEDWLARNRPDLLPTIDVLRSQSRARQQEHRQSMDEEQHLLAPHLRDLSVHLADLADPQDRLAIAALGRIEQATDTPLSALEQAWIRHVARTLKDRVDTICDHLVQRIHDEGKDADEARRLVDSGELGELLRLLGESRKTSGAGHLRATLLRKDAARLWPNPPQRLSRAVASTADLGTDERSQRLVETWLELRRALRRRPLQPDEAKALRQTFAEFLFQATARRRKHKVRSYTPQGGQTHYLQVDLADVRQWLVEDVGNPTFLPQLARYTTLSIKVAPVGVRDRSLARRIHAESSQSEITLVLAPGLDPEQRDQVRSHLSTQPFTAPIAIFDDLDICRIVNFDGEAPDPMLGTLEIMAEQQPWERFCPYEVLEGQHVRLEMFVGRMKEAEGLAMQATYGRIFSGRRLGKTALLRFVEGNPRFRKVPSGNELHIVFCSIAGQDTEEAVSRSIIQSIRRHLGDADAVADPAELEDPVSYLKTFIPKFLEERPNESWLVLLDEADSFFGAQINSAIADQQKSLSWWMSRHSETITDSFGLPRIRFVFCGYLRTDQNRGVWENKGDVLLLRPLAPKDAVELVAGPLARIGIDARQQADNIAFQCGYQPSVLVRFGVTMVEHLHRTVPLQDREGYTVRPKDVLDTFTSNAVQRAIEEACWLNFVGHPTGQLVFAAILMELRERVAFATLDDLPRVVLERIREAEPGFDPADHFTDNWDDLVAHQLRELVDRSLLVQVAHRPATYRLRFPHHLPVLVRQDPAQRVRDALHRLENNGRETENTWVLPLSAVDEIRYALSEEGQDLGCRAIVVASMWSDPLLDPDTGLVPRLATGAGRTAPPWFDGAEAVDRLCHLGDLDGPCLLLGGMQLARQTSTRANGDILAWHSYRMSTDQVLGWFQRRRATEFAARDAPQRIMQATGGIPLLVGALDDLLQRDFSTAPTIGEDDLDRILESLEDRVPELRARLLDSDDPNGLTPREVELVRMVLRASREYEDPELMRVAISDHELDLPAGVDPYTPEDGPALRLLVQMGLLPRANFAKGGALEEVGLVGPTDAVVRLLDLSPA